MEGKRQRWGKKMGEKDDRKGRGGGGEKERQTDTKTATSLAAVTMPTKPSWNKDLRKPR